MFFVRILSNKFTQLDICALVSQQNNQHAIAHK